MKLAIAQARADQWSAALESYKLVNQKVWFYRSNLGRVAAEGLLHGRRAEVEGLLEEQPAEDRLEFERGVADGLLRRWACDDPDPRTLR